MKQSKQRQGWAIAAAVLIGLGGGRALAAEAGVGITVTGTGEVKAKPDVIELSTLVSGSGELSADAMVTFNNNRRRALAAIEGAGIDGIQIVPQGIQVSSGVDPEQLEQMMMMGMGGNQQPGDEALNISEPLTIVMHGVAEMDDEQVMEAMMGLIEAAQDAGLKLGSTAATNLWEMQMRGGQPQALAVFKLNEVDELKQEAYAAAMTEARANAQRLAELAGVTLGQVRSIREGPAQMDTDSPSSYMYAMMGMQEPDDGEYESGSLGLIPVRVSLVVQFDIE